MDPVRHRRRSAIWPIALWWLRLALARNVAIPPRAHAAHIPPGNRGRVRSRLALPTWHDNRLRSEATIGAPAFVEPASSVKTLANLKGQHKGVAASGNRMDGFVLRLAAVYGGIFVAMGVQLPFLPVWFAAKGLDSPTIGVVLASAIAARLIVVPLATHATDRVGQLKPAIVLASLAACAAYAALAFGDDAVTLFILYALASAAAAVLLPLVETYAVHGLQRRQRAYGPVRLWASVAFIAGNLIAGAAAPLLAPTDIVWLIVAAYAGCCLLTPWLLPFDLPKARDVPTRTTASQLRVTVVVLAVVAASCVQASHAFYYAFSALEWRTGGFSSLSIGFLWALGVAAEIALFAASSRFPAWIAPTHLLLTGAIGGVVRWTAMAFDPSAVVLAPLQCLHGLSFGATHLGAVLLIARAAPIGRAATAQGALATALGVAMALALVASGFLRPDFGSASYAAMAVLACIGAACAFAAYRSAKAGAFNPRAPETED